MKGLNWMTSDSYFAQVASSGRRTQTEMYSLRVEA